MQIVKPGININFIGNRKIAFAISGLLILMSIVSLVIKNGPRYGIDFSGGTMIQVKFPNTVTSGAIKSGLKASELNLKNISVQAFGATDAHEFLIRTDMSMDTAQGFSQKIIQILKDATGSEPEIRRVEMVGPKVGKDLREKALFAMFFSLLFITIYISGRFEFKWLVSAIMAFSLIAVVYGLRLLNMSIPLLILGALIATLILFAVLKLKYAMGAIVALIHDVTITVGIFSVLDKEFSLPIIAALLTIIGYSLNDTIIVFDRIRENLKKNIKESLGIIINKSINETLNRTIITSLTTLIVIVCLFALGGDIIHDFSFAMIVGVVIGTYSSIFVASPILMTFETLGQKRR